MKIPYQHNIFYNTNSISKEDRLLILQDALDVCYDWHLDTIVGMRREKIVYATKEDVINYYKKEMSYDQFNVIHSRGYEEWKDKEFFPHRWCGEIGYRIASKTQKDIFSFIYVTEDELKNIVEKYNLEIR